jgi:rare lipoprotein A
MGFINRLRSLSLTLVGVGVLLSGCTETQYVAHLAKQIPFPTDTPKTTGYYKVGNPYEIKGRQYRPQESFDHVETGIASWYGPNFHGKKTANGEIFNENELTAAHRTLQMPSLVRVTNLENGKSLILRVNDRGPFAHDRVIDVSKKASELLGFRTQGTAKVRVEVIPEESNSRFRDRNE